MGALSMTPTEAIAAYRQWDLAQRKEFMNLLEAAEPSLVVAYHFLLLAVRTRDKKLSRRQKAERDAEILRLSTTTKDVLIARQLGMTPAAVRQARRRAKRKP